MFEVCVSRDRMVRLNDEIFADGFLFQHPRTRTEECQDYIAVVLAYPAHKIPRKLLPQLDMRFTHIAAQPARPADVAQKNSLADPRRQLLIGDEFISVRDCIAYVRQCWRNDLALLMNGKCSAARVPVLRNRAAARIRVLPKHRKPDVVRAHFVKDVKHVTRLWDDVYIRLNNRIQYTVDQRTVRKEKVFPSIRQQHAIKDVGHIR